MPCRLSGATRVVQPGAEAASTGETVTGCAHSACQGDGVGGYDRGAATKVTLAYMVWGVMVLFWPLLGRVGAWEILAHRVIWSSLFVVLCLVVLRRPWGWLRRLRHYGWRLAAAAVLIGLNWVTFIWALIHGFVAETALGYFLNPLLNVLLGMLVFRERPTRAALAGVGCAAAGVAVISVVMSSTVWVALSLATTFAVYGVVKKRAPVGALEGLAFESTVLAPLALAYLAWLGPGGTFGTDLPLSLLLVLAGPLTALPLGLFAAAAPRLPMSLLGMLQFIAPTTSLVLGVTVVGQRVPLGYWLGLALVWTGLALYLTSSVRRRPVPTEPC